MENNERPASILPAEKDAKIQLVMNAPESDETTIDLGRVFHNAKLKSRIFAWVLVLCILVGLCAPLLMYQLNKPELTVTSVVTLRYGTDNLKAPDGSDLDLTAVTSSPVLQKALDGLVLSEPVTIETLRNNLRVTRVLTEASSRDREILAGLADAKDKELYNRLEGTELQYQNRFIVSLTNGFGQKDEDGEIKDKRDLKGEELTILLNRILDAYNDSMIREYADVRLPEDRVSLIDTEEMDLPEIIDALGSALDELYDYCSRQTGSTRSYRSWKTGRSLDEWMRNIRTVKSLSIDYLEAYVYAKGIMRDRDAVSLTYQYNMRTLQSDLDKIAENVEKTEALLKDYKNNEVLVNMQESDSARTTKMTTSYYNDLVMQQLGYYRQATNLRTKIADTRNKLDRLAKIESVGELANVESELKAAIDTVKGLQDSVRAHMTEVFESPLFTTYTEHSAPIGKLDNFIKANLKKMIIFAVAGAVVACGLWFLAALVPEFRRGREEDERKAEAAGKEAREA